MRSRRVSMLALLLALGLMLSACAQPEEEEGNGGGTPAEDNSDFLACQVTDTGGIDDKSFNQTAYEGLTKAEEDFGIEIQFLESQTPNDFEPNINQFVQQGCDLIVTVGFLLGDATAKAAEANPDQKFAIVDVDFFDADKGEDITYDNVKELTFATDQAAFLAGYVSAAISETGTLATYGGIPIPPVTIFMNGFLAGANYYNSEEGGNVEVLGWDGKDGTFTGDFENQDNGKQVTESFLDEGADIILPVAGPVGLGSVAAVEDAGEGALVWVDTDGCVSVPEACSLLVTSVMKNMNVAVYDAIEQALNDEFEGGLYSGTLENGGVGIAPYHEYESQIPQEVKDKVDEIKSGIIDGSISLTP